MVDEWEIDLKEPLISIVLWNHKHSVPHWKNTNLFFSLYNEKLKSKKISLDKIDFGLKSYARACSIKLGHGHGHGFGFLVK